MENNKEISVSLLQNNVVVLNINFNGKVIIISQISFRDENHLRQIIDEKDQFQIIESINKEILSVNTQKDIAALILTYLLK